MAEEQILNNTFKRIAHFLGKVLPSTTTHMPLAVAHVPTPEKRLEIPTVADDKLEAASTASSTPQEIFYESKPTRGAVRDVAEQEVTNNKARHFGTTASPYLVK
jgi:hypothetical protein